MSYSQQRVRQQIIQACLQQAQIQKQQSIQLALSDPFETYYYPTPLQDEQQINNLKIKIKSKLIANANIQKMDQIQSQLNNELYIINQQIKAEELQQQSMDFVIKQLQGQLAMQKNKKEIKNIVKSQKIQKVSLGCQTYQPKYKQEGIMADQLATTHKFVANKQKQLYTMPSFSMSILSQTSKSVQNNENQKKKISASAQIDKNNYTQKINKVNKTKQIQQVKQSKGHQFNRLDKVIKQNADASNIKSLYAQLQKQMRYLQHLKASKNRKQYLQQKMRIKFMIELFWKNTQSSSQLDKSDESLPFFQI